MSGSLLGYLGEQKALSGIQNAAQSFGQSGLLDPQTAALIQQNPRLGTEIIPQLIQQSAQLSALGQLNGQGSSGTNQLSANALQQYGSSGDQSPNSPVPQALPSMQDSSQTNPQNQNPLQPQGTNSPMQMLRQAAILGRGNIGEGLKALQAQKQLQLPPGVTLSPGTEFVNGQVVPIPGAAQAAATQQTSTKSAETTGTNLAEAQKTLAVMQSNLPALNARLDEMKTYATGKGPDGKPVQGVTPASYGPHWLIDDEGEGPLADYHNSKQDPTAVSNAMLKQRAAQGILPELGPSLAQAGIKGNKFLEQIASSASGVPLNASPEAKAAAIEGLRSQYLRNMNATQQQVQQLSGQAPSPQQQQATQPSNNQPDPRLLAHLKNRGLLGE